MLRTCTTSGLEHVMTFRILQRGSDTIPLVSEFSETLTMKNHGPCTTWFIEAPPGTWPQYFSHILFRITIILHSFLPTDKLCYVLLNN